MKQIYKYLFLIFCLSGNVYSSSEFLPSDLHEIKKLREFKGFYHDKSKSGHISINSHSPDKSNVYTIGKNKKVHFAHFENIGGDSFPTVNMWTEYAIETKSKDGKKIIFSGDHSYLKNKKKKIYGNRSSENVLVLNKEGIPVAETSCHINERPIVMNIGKNTPIEQFNSGKSYDSDCSAISKNICAKVNDIVQEHTKDDNLLRNPYSKQLLDKAKKIQQCLDDNNYIELAKKMKTIYDESNTIFDLVEEERLKLSKHDHSKAIEGMFSFSKKNKVHFSLDNLVPFTLFTDLDNLKRKCQRVKPLYFDSFQGKRVKEKIANKSSSVQKE